MTYWPSLLVVAIRVAPVPASRSSTFAPGTPAPEGSTTCPSTCPVVSVCPRAGFTCQKTHSENRTVQKKNFTIAAAIFAVITHPLGLLKPLRHQWRSEEHTSELQSHLNLVCRLLL